MMGLCYIMVQLYNNDTHLTLRDLDIFTFNNDVSRR